MSTYRRANTTAQWYADNYPGDEMTPNVVVLHTTEGTDWPGYDGGATAPNTTAKPDIPRQRLLWRAHFPDEMSSRALRNLAGGVETNTLNVVQVELIGTCDPKHRHTWAGQGKLRAGRDYIFWPDAPRWALNDVAAFLADQHERHGLKLDAPALWLPYPTSYGASAARMGGAAWRDFYGVCGHQHVPENSHGDPGNLDIVAILDRARELVVDGRAADQAAKGPTPVSRARAGILEQLERLDSVPAKRKRVHRIAADIRKLVDELPLR